MRGVNRVTILGTLGADPEARQFNNGGSVTNISVATTEQWTDKQNGEKKEATEWHRISLANRLGEIAAQYLRKGSKVYIEGMLKTRKYQAADGSDRYVTEIKGFSMQMLDSAGGQQNQQQNNQQSNQQNGNYQQPRSETGLSPQQNQGFNNQMSNQQQAPQGIQPPSDDVPF